MNKSAESERESPKSGRFEFQRWPVYREAVEFNKQVNRLENLPSDGRRGLTDQLKRAGQSICLNIALIFFLMVELERPVTRTKYWRFDPSMAYFSSKNSGSFRNSL